MPLPAIDLNEIKDKKLRELVSTLLNIIEDLSVRVHRLQEENQHLRDENNRLKGEQGKPDIKAKQPPRDHSSERERHTPRGHKKRSKRAEITINQEEILKVDRTLLPSDAVFKGYEETLVQEITLQTSNVLFRKEKYYSASTGKTYLAALPSGYVGAFGPNLRAQILNLYYVCQMTEGKIHNWLCQIGIDISVGTISNILIKDHHQFHQEEAASYEASLAGSPWQHIDDTGTRVNGANHYCHIVDSPLATHYQTTPSKSRLDVIDVLRNGRERVFRWNDEAYQLMKTLNVPQYALKKLYKLSPNQNYGEDFMEQWLLEHLSQVSKQHRASILSSLAVIAYQSETNYPVVKLLLCDDAPQFTRIATELALCWIHEGRHYKKLSPVVFYHQQLRDKLLHHFWKFYQYLNRYRDYPTPKKAAWLERYFDRLFATRTGYQELDKLIARTQKNKTQLLMVLTHPEIPLHNNPAELGARQRVRKRKISFGPRVDDGVKAWDTFMSLIATTKKLGINFHDYILDRIMDNRDIPPLPDLIYARSLQLNLGASWADT